MASITHRSLHMCSYCKILIRVGSNTFKSIWVQVQILSKVFEYKYWYFKYFEKVFEYKYKYFQKYLSKYFSNTFRFRWNCGFVYTREEHGYGYTLTGKVDPYPYKGKVKGRVDIPKIYTGKGKGRVEGPRVRVRVEYMLAWPLTRVRPVSDPCTFIIHSMLEFSTQQN